MKGEGIKTLHSGHEVVGYSIRNIVNNIVITRYGVR